MSQVTVHRLQVSLVVVLILPFAFLLLPLACFGQPLSSTELINNAQLYDGQIVAYQGEVIGDIMPRGEYAWINIHDGTNAIGIWVKNDLIKDIGYTGNYKFKGDLVEVSGIFQRACALHGGDLDIHAESIRKISQGRKIEERVNLEKKNLAIILAGILGLVWILSLLKTI